MDLEYIMNNLDAFDDAWDVTAEEILRKYIEFNFNTEELGLWLMDKMEEIADRM